MELAGRINVVAAACLTAALCTLAGSQLVARITVSQRENTPVGPSTESTLKSQATDQSGPSSGDSSPNRQEPSEDLYGNEVASAVATYKLDESGTIYEEHSPQTEVPRLGAPKS